MHLISKIWQWLVSLFTQITQKDGYKLYIDDVRTPSNNPEEWVIARNMAAVRAICEERGAPEYVSFDHDLGIDRSSGYEIAQMMVDNGWKPDEWNVHSANPIGSKKIRNVLENNVTQDKWEEKLKDM